MPSFYTEEILELVKDANDIVDVVSEYVKLKRSGRNYFGLCPFHSEKTPSFSVSPEKQIFYCFGCGVGGNVIHFIIKIENLSFVEAVKFLAERARIELPEADDRNFDYKSVKLKEEILKINAEAGRYFYSNLIGPKGTKAREYLVNRGISDVEIKKFGLGYADEESNDLVDFLQRKGFSEEVILASGLVYKSKKNELRDKFKSRIIFPILDAKDRIVGFGGRVLDNSLPKYLNSPETLVFNKRKNLYGLNLARRSGERTVIVVEGYMDVISLHKYGMTNVVATLGTSFTQEQARLLRKYFEEIIIAYDSDVAGQNAAMRGLELISNMDIPVKIVRFEGAKDPDEFVRKNGIELFKEVVANAKSLVEYKIEVLKNQFNLNDINQKVKFVNKVVSVLVKVQSDIERDAYVKKISKETGISVEPIYAVMDKILYSKEKPLKTSKSSLQNLQQITKEQTDINVKVLQAERKLISLLSMNNKELFKLVREKINPEDLSSQINRKIIQIIYEIYQNKGEIKFLDVMDRLESEEEVNTYAEIVQSEDNIDIDVFKAADQLIEVIEKEKLKLRRQKIILEMKNTELTDEEVKKLNEELKAITYRLSTMKKK